MAALTKASADLLSWRWW